MHNPDPTSDPAVTTAAASDGAALAIFDQRAFFEKALAYGIAHGILGKAKLDSIANDAPKGMVQIARYFGNEYLRPELEKAKDRIVNLVSLHLEHSSKGDLAQAAHILREHSFLSRSKAGSDMLKALIAMPQSSHFGMHTRGGFTDEHIPQLAKWSLRSLAEYQAELAKREQVENLIDAAVWLAQSLGTEEDDLADAGCDAEAVIRTALLVLSCKRQELPDWVGFESLVANLRKRSTAITITLPANIPSAYAAVVHHVHASVVADLPKMLDKRIGIAKLFRQTPAFLGRYYWEEDPLAEVEVVAHRTSGAWQRATGGHFDDGSLLTLFLCIAAGSTKKTMLSASAATSLVRKIRKTGIQAELTRDFISANAPALHQADYLALWDGFLQDAGATLTSDHDYTLNDAVALLRRDCNVT